MNLELTAKSFKSGQNGTAVRLVGQGPKFAVMSIFCAALALLSPWSTYLQIAPFTTPVTIIVALMTGLMLVRFFRKPVILVARQDLYLILYVMLVTGSYFWTLTKVNWGNYIFWWYICVATYFAAHSAISTAADLRLVNYAFFVGLLITFTNLQLTFDEWGNSSLRYCVFGHNSNFTAYVLSGGLFLFLVTWIHLGATRTMVFLLPIWIGMTFYSEILLGTRGAMLSSALTIFVFFLRRFIPNSGLKGIIYSMVIISLGVAVGFTDFVLSFFDSFGSGRGTGDLSNRGFIWAEAYSYMFSHPIIGIGPGSFADISELRAGAHNIFLTIGLDGGLVGILLFGSFIFFYLRNVLQKALSNREGMVLLAMFSCFWFPIVSSGHWELAPFSWLLLALFGRLSSIEKDRRTVKLRIFTRAT